MLATMARAAGSALRRARSALGRVWRVSLQFRVVVTTMALVVVALAVLQGFTYQRIADGLVEASVNSARQDAAYLARRLQGLLEQTDQDDPAAVRRLVYDEVFQQRSAAEEQSRDVVFTRVESSTGLPVLSATISTGPDLAAIPPELREAVARDPQHQQVQIATVAHGGSAVPTVLIGSQVVDRQLGQYEAYHLYPMTSEQRTLGVVQRTFLLGSVIFVLLMGLVVWAVTHFVVDPVREAAVVAGRLSSGRLNERMRVKGEDDLATLATSFNDMADHLQSQIQRLEELSQVQQRFVSDVSHELRTPLTTIRMAAGLIHDERQSFAPVVSRSAELLFSEVERFEALLADLLEISRFDAGAAVLERSNGDLRDVAERVASALGPLARRRGVELVIEGADEPCRCEMDVRRVERIVRNLVVNAIEHSDGQPVHIELGGNETAVAIAVRDHGVGLRPGEADLVFNRFWRGDPARNRTTGGTGLGLAIALEDARLHEGWLHAWGEPGKGARFRLTLPKVAGRPIGYPPVPLIEPDATLPAGPSLAGPAPDAVPAPTAVADPPAPDEPRPLTEQSDVATAQAAAEPLAPAGPGGLGRDGQQP